MTAPSQALRKLAEEIGREILSAVSGVYEDQGKQPLSDDLVASQLPRHAAHWEARLLAALPELSQLFGELVVAQKIMSDAREALNSLPLDALGSGWTPEGQEYPLRDELIFNLTRALSSDSGQLAAELTRAAVEEELATERATRAWERHERDQVSMSHVANYERALAEPPKRQGGK